MEHTNYPELEERFPDINERHRYLRAQNRLRELKSFYTHFFIYLIVNAIIIISNMKHEVNWGIDSFGTAILWGIVILIHAGVVFLPNFVMGKNWEEKKIQEFMEKYKN